MHPKSSGSGSSSAQLVRPRRVGLNPYQADRLKARLRAASPSEPWVDAQFGTVVDEDEAGRQIIYHFHDPRVFPPGGADTAMIRCPECGILMPPNAFEDGRCLDHATHTGWGPSPSALAIAALERRHLALQFAPLEPEDAVSLRREIREYEAKLPKSRKKHH
jgi:hypothetical protein